MNVRDMVTDVGISIDACNLLRHFVAVASVRDDTAKSVDDVSCCVCEKKAIRCPIDSAP